MAARTSQNVTYPKSKGLGNDHYEGLITALVDSCQGVSRQDINELLWDQLPLHLSDEAKTRKIDQLINNLRRAHRIRNTGSRSQPQWISALAGRVSAPARNSSGRVLATAASVRSLPSAPIDESVTKEF